MKRFALYILTLLTMLLSSPAANAEGLAKTFTVVIDAGHGGHDPGAVGKKAKEKNINLKTALVLGRLIEQNCPDVKVVYTRKTDVFVELHRRAQIANNAKADLFISIHTNSLPKGKIARGAETYTLGMAKAQENLEVAKKENNVILMESNYKTMYKGFNPNSSESYIIFEFMQDQNMSQSVSFAKKIQQQFRNNAKRVDKGVKQAGFLVLRETSMPSVLVELGYISTPDEENYLASDQGIQAMGRSIYNAFLSYKNGKSGGSTTIQPVMQTVDAAPEEPEMEPVKTSEPEKKVEPTQKENPSTTIANADGIVFAVQFLTSDQLLKASDKRFKGLKNVQHFKDGKIYKYTYGNSPNYNEVYRKRKEIATQFKDCFIIALRNGERMDVNEAIRIFKAKK